MLDLTQAERLHLYLSPDPYHFNIHHPLLRDVIGWIRCLVGSGKQWRKHSGHFPSKANSVGLLVQLPIRPCSSSTTSFHFVLWGSKRAEMKRENFKMVYNCLTSTWIPRNLPQPHVSQDTGQRGWNRKNNLVGTGSLPKIKFRSQG